MPVTDERLAEIVYLVDAGWDQSAMLKTATLREIVTEIKSARATLAAIQSLVDEYLRTTTEAGLVGTSGQELCERIKEALK